MYYQKQNRNTRPHRKLIAWQKAMDLAVVTYKMVSAFPAEERFGLASQMKRASVSVPSNIAEGAAGRTAKAFLNYLLQADGSQAELDTQLELSRRLGYSTVEQLAAAEALLDETSALVGGLKRSQRKLDASV